MPVPCVGGLEHNYRISKARIPEMKYIKLSMLAKNLFL